MEVVVHYCDCEVENSSLALLMDDDVHDIAAVVVEEEHTFVNVNDKKIVVVAVVDG